MVRKNIVFHNLSHLLLPFIIFFIVLYYTPELNALIAFLAALAGSFFLDLDHLQIKKICRYKSFYEFFGDCLVSDRFRKGTLIFHNLLSMLIAFVSFFAFVIINLYLGIFFLACFAHLLLDFLTDKWVIKIHSHWKLRSWI